MRELTREEKAIIYLDSFEYFEYKHKAFVLDTAKNPLKIFIDNRLIDEYFEKNGIISQWNGVKKLAFDKERCLEIIRKALRGADDVITIVSPNYPKELKAISCPPLVLYLKGNANLLQKHKFAMVGSRRTLPQYLAKAEEIARDLSECGTVLVTGNAFGGDSAVIKGGLNSGNIISVLPCGLDSIVPKTQLSLCEDVAKNGLLLSEFPSGYLPRIYTYPLRNRLIAGLSEGMMVISGDMESGARYTLAYGEDYGREIFCLPYGIGVKSGELSINYIKKGAVLVESAKEIADAMNYDFHVTKKVEYTEEEKAILALIENGYNTADSLSEKADLGISKLMSIIGMLELKGAIIKDSAGKIEKL